MNGIRKLIRDIDNGKNLERNLPVYADKLADVYADYATVELTLTVYLLAETIEEQDGVTEDETAMYEEIIRVMERVIGTQETKELQEQVSHMEEIRKRITEVMEVYTSYTDRLINYDYVLERMEFAYPIAAKEAEEIKKFSEENFLERLIAYLFGEKDPQLSKERLQELIGLLPVHMTKSKFLERVQETLTLYEGSDKESLESFVYAIRSTAMLLNPKPVIVDEKAQALLEKLEEADFKSMDEETFLALQEEMEQVSEEIYRKTDMQYSMQQVVNSLYALCLVKLQKQEDSKLLDICQPILQQVIQGQMSEDLLESIEGYIEKTQEQSSYLEAILFQTKETQEELLVQLGLDEVFEVFGRVANLLSDSLFVDLEDKTANEMVDKEMIKQTTAQLTEELSQVLSKHSRPVKKAIMAAVLEKLPRPFESVYEVDAYIRTNLFGCENEAEKISVLLALDELMEEARRWRDM